MDFIRKFFRLTLDNVYRFACALLFSVTVLGLFSHRSPIGQLGAVVDWLGLPSQWVSTIGAWIEIRREGIGLGAWFLLLIAVGFMANRHQFNRAGSTGLLAAVLLVQTGIIESVLWLFFFGLLCLTLLSGAVLLLSRRLDSALPEWPSLIWGWVGRVFRSFVEAIAYLFAPVVWLISEDFSANRGSFIDPIVVEVKDKRVPSGSLPRRT